MEKEQQNQHELSLGQITTFEYAGHRPTFEEYSKLALSLLKVNEVYVFEDDILKKHNALTMDQVNLKSPDRFVDSGLFKPIENKQVKLWYDLWANYIIMPDDLFYDSFFAYSLRQTDLLDIENFLAYQLSTYYDNEIHKFSRFLRLMIRKHENRDLLPSNHVLTINEWIEEQLKLESSDISKAITIKTKGRLKREADDGLTLLNQEQTVLLIHYLQKAKIIYKGEYLSNTDAGMAFSILTGYSPDTIRQALGEKELERLRNKKNLSDLANTFTRVLNIVEREIREK